jgi:hypothetical protein
MSMRSWLRNLVPSSFTASNPSEPVAGGLVTFTAPATGASATLSGNPATIQSDGTASVTATRFLSGGFGPAGIGGTSTG